MIWQPGFLYNARLIAFVLLIAAGCTSSDNRNTNDVEIPDKQDVSYDVNEESDIDESTDTSMNPKDSEIQEDAKEEQDSEVEDSDVEDKDTGGSEDTDADIDEEYENKLQYLDEYYSTHVSGSLMQYQQWLIVKPEFMKNLQSGYLVDFLAYNKSSSYQLAAFSGHPEHDYISSLPGGSAIPIIHDNHLFVVGFNAPETEDEPAIPSIRIYDLNVLPQIRVLQEILLNKPIVGLEPEDVRCTSPDRFLVGLNFFITKEAVIVNCEEQMIRHALLKDINGLFYIGESKAVVGMGTSMNRSYTMYDHQTSDGKVYLVMENSNLRMRDVFLLNQDGIATKISEFSLPQYEVRDELVQPVFANRKPEWVGNHLWIPTDRGPFAAVFDMSNPAQPTFLHYTQKFGTLLRVHASGPYVFALVSSASAASLCTEELFDEHCLTSKFDVMLYHKDSPAPVSSLSNVIELDTDDDGFDNYSSIGDIVFDDPMLYLTQTHQYAQDESTQRGILKVDLSERLSALPF